MTDSAYPAAMRVLHWLMATIIIAALVLGVWAINLPRGPLRGEMIDVHKSLGVTALVLIVLRILVRLASRTPPYRPPLGRLDHFAARVVHGLLYLVMIAQPLSGYVHSMAGGHGFRWFGLIPVPNLVGRSEQADAGAGQAHYVFAWTIGALVLIHVLAALWHGARRDRVLARMVPGAP